MLCLRNSKRSEGAWSMEHGAWNIEREARNTEFELA
jgi:hypothetical protein